MNHKSNGGSIMCEICPKCGSIAEYDAYHGRKMCTRCTWESEKIIVKSSSDFRISKSVRRIKVVKSEF